MTRTSITLAGRAVVAGIALTALGALAASPAAAAVPALYTYVAFANPYGYSTMSATDGAVTVLPTLPTNPADTIVGQELTDGVGTAIGLIDGEPDQYGVHTWNSTTGASDSGTGLFLTGADEGSLLVSGLDTRNDGTLITYVEYTTTSGGEFPTTTPHAAVATLNRATGELIPVIDVFPFVEIGFVGISLATDPTTGVSYLFFGQDEGDDSFYSALDFVTFGLDLPSIFEGTGFGNGFFQGADFDASGTLWFIYGNNEREAYELSTLGSPDTWFSDARTYVADSASNYDSYPLSTLALTTAPKPALADTGAEFPVALLAVGTVAVLGGVVAVVTVSRKRRTA